MGIEENVGQKRIKSQIQHYMGIGRYEKIKPLASDLISSYPEYGYGYYAMAIYEDYQGRTENAIELCHKAAEYGMSRLGTGILLMIYYDKIDGYANADDEYHALMRQYPFCYDAMAIHGYSLWRRGRRDEGIALLQKAFSENPTDPMIIKFLLTAIKNSKDAEMLLKLYMDSRASDKQKLVLAGLHEIHVSNWSEAKMCFEKVLGMDPTDNEALYFMSVIKLKKSLPLLFIAAIGFGALVYLFRFDPQNLLSSVYFLIPLIILLFAGYIFVKIRSISGNRSKIETKIVNFLDRILRENNRAGQKRINTQAGGRLHTAGLKINRKLSRFSTKLIFAISISLILLGGVYKKAEINFKEHAVTVTAEVAGFNERGYPIVSFVADGKEYKVPSRSRIPNASVGSKAEVQYHSEYPSNVQYGENPLYKSAIPMIILGSLVTLGYGYFVFRK